MTMNGEEKNEEERHLKRSVDLLFSKYVEQEPSDIIKTISEYFFFLAKNIDTKKLAITADRSFIEVFEAVCLLLQEKIRLYPDSVREQVNDLLQHRKIGQLFGAIATVGDEDFQRIVTKSEVTGTFRILNLFSRLFGSSLRNGGYGFILDRASLTGYRVALNRLGQILRYASTIELIDYETGADELKDHYDPNLVNREKILALIGILRVQLGQVPDDTIQKKVSQRLNVLEEQIKRRNPKWGRIIAGIFILFGFLADLKTLNPNIYSPLYDTVERIIVTVHDDGMVQKKQRLLPGHRENSSSETDNKELPSAGFGPSPQIADVKDSEED